MVLKYEDKNIICDNLKGPRGEKGETGDKGEKGPTGDKGEIGPKGPPGEEGPLGEKGEKGVKGDTGDKGPPGAVGLRGPRGPKGVRGDKGSKGPRGDKGDRGDTGDKGPFGDKGPRGDKGETGATGPLGNKGISGITGQRGEAGDKGPKGDRGDRGEDGLPGLKGETGDRGETGDKGPRGDKGPQGVAGIKGITGIPGKCIPRPSEVVLAKVGQIIRDDALECYVRLSNSSPINKAPLEIIENKKIIIESNISYLEFEGGIVIPVRNIDSINIVMEQVEISIIINTLDLIKEIFEAIYDCDKNAPVIVSIGPNGAPVSAGSPLVDHEYVKLCTCRGDGTGTCECTAKKVDVCKYRAYKTENLKIEMEKVINNSKKIDILRTSREGFADMGDAGALQDISVEKVCSGAAALTFTTNKGGKTYTTISIVNLDKVSMFKIKD